MNSLGPWSVMLPIVGNLCILVAARGASAVGFLKRLGEGTSEKLLPDTNITKARLIPDPAAGQCELSTLGRGSAQGLAQGLTAK